MIKKIGNWKLKIKNYNSGMTYVELIVVLSIFATMTSVVLFNYGGFQSKVDIKNLGSDIALKIVEAQKSSTSGLLPIQTPTVSPWKPAYGVYFNNTDVDNTSFIYFTDLNNDNFDNDLSCSLPPNIASGECLDQIKITKNNHISRIDSYLGSVATQIKNPLFVTFKRPNSAAVFYYLDSEGALLPLPGFDYVQISIISSQSDASNIKIYPSGRIQVN